MAIGLVEMQGGIPRVQDFASIKHQEDTKGLVDQSNLAGQSERKIDEKTSQVVSKENASKSNNQADAKEQGRGQYAGDGGTHRKKDEVPANGRVVVKGSSHFDVRL